MGQFKLKWRFYLVQEAEGKINDNRTLWTIVKNENNCLDEEAVYFKWKVCWISDNLEVWQQ